MRVLIVFALVVLVATNTQADCGWTDLERLSSEAVAEYVAGQEVDCLRFLWQPDGKLKQVFSDDNMLAVVHGLKNAEASDTSPQGHRALMLFARIGFFHAWYGRSVGFNKSLVLPLLLQVLRDMERDPWLWEPDSTLMIGAWLSLLDAVSTDMDVFWSSFERTLQVYGDPDSITNDRGKLLFSLFGTMQRFMGEEKVAAMISDTLVTDLGRLGRAVAIDDRNKFVTNNAIWTLRSILRARVTAELKAQVLGELDRVLEIQPKLSEPYVWAVKVLTEDQDCYTTLNQQSVCRTKVTAQLKRRLFPNRISFEPGGDIYETSLNQDRVAQLYNAIQQVWAGFKMLTHVEDPLPGDTNARATLVIYGSKADYKAYHPFLFNIATANGGIYIEKTGTLFTYDRTASESIYTLEELVRHEYVHYIVARYLIHGSFGQTPFYQNDRLTWFDEGIAELLAGSDGQSVRLRVSLVKGLARDGTRRMAVKEIVTAAYGGGFKFYRYAGALLAFLAKEEQEILNALVYVIRANHVDRYDQIIAALHGDVRLEQRFQNYLDQVVKSYARPVTRPILASTRLLPQEPLPEDMGCRARLYDLARIENVLQDVLAGSAVQCELRDPKRVGRDPDSFYYVGSVTCQSQDPRSLAMASAVKGEMEKRKWFGYRGEAYGQRLTIRGSNSTPMCQAT